MNKRTIDSRHIPAETLCVVDSVSSTMQLYMMTGDVSSEYMVLFMMDIPWGLVGGWISEQC